MEAVIQDINRKPSTPQSGRHSTLHDATVTGVGVGTGGTARPQQVFTVKVLFDLSKQFPRGNFRFFLVQINAAEKKKILKI